MRITADVSGLSEFRNVLERWFDEAPHELGVTLYEEGEEIIGDSKEHYVPVDLGNLKSTGHVEQPDISDDQILVILGFGGPAADYALIVHEDMDAEHEVGEAKYLEIPFFRRVEGLPERLADRAEEILDD